ncbi:hypothetical protein AB0I93_00045 [Streptomyces sp. NPDC049967]|uniref:hypothetical protein n=1 Tax=Streptomyces sp. NPDC049967 TaxID=3155658 RepID=UPI0034383136
MSTPPKPGKGLSVKVDQQLYDDLATMMRAGITVSDAVREAVNIIAGTCRNAWAMGAYPDGVLPQVIACQVVPYDPGNTVADADGTLPGAGLAERPPRL